MQAGTPSGVPLLHCPDRNPCLAMMIKNVYIHKKIHNLTYCGICYKMDTNKMQNMLKTTIIFHFIGKIRRDICA